MTNIRSFARTLGVAAIATSAALFGASARAQETVTLKVHHFPPAGSYAHTQFIQPWCDKVAKESANRLKCQIYPSMQLGGTPPQLFDQAKDGVADVVWTLGGYTAGRFPLTEVFELPFMTQGPEAARAHAADHAAARRIGCHPGGHARTAGQRGAEQGCH